MKKSPPAPLLHFDMRSGSYWCPLDSGEYLALDTGQAKLHLRAAGLDPDQWTDNGLNEVERALFLSQRERFCHYAGPLAGWTPGAFETADGRRCLVTSGPRLPVAKAGKCEALDRFLGELLGGEQGHHFLLWLTAAREALAKRTFRPGQLVALAGPSGCGKSLLQSVITAALGGRCASPYLYMVGETSFNADLAQAEHWAIEDRASSTDIRTRRKFGAALKEAVVNREIQVHAKGRQAIVLPTFRRVTASMNDEPENLMLLPPMDESISDKVNLYQCAVADVGDDRERTWSTFMRELPAFLFDAAKLPIPKRWKDDRYGVRAYHNQTLLDVLTAASPEVRLLAIIDDVLFGARAAASFWTGSAVELEKVLLSGEFGHAVSRLLYYSTAGSVYLARLAVKHPERIEAIKRGGKTVWTIRAP